MSTLVEKQNLNLIQMLRGVASVLVVLFHATFVTNQVLNKEFIFDIFSSGFTGVDIFFVLSGFIITYTNFKVSDKPGKIWNFIRRRIIRIYPPYWIIISAFLIMQILLPGFYETQFSLGPTNLISTYLLSPYHVMINGVSWSLTFELYFYALFLLIFIMPNKRWALIFFLIYALFLFFFTFLGYYKNLGDYQKLVFYPLNIEFFLGVLSALIVKKLSGRTGAWLIVSGILLYIFSSILNNASIYLFKTDLNRVVLFGIPAFLLITGVVSYELNNKIKTPRIFLLLGDASYSLYLMHLPILVAFIKLYSKLNIQDVYLYHVLVICLIIFICWISILFFRLIERPITTYLNKGSSKSRNLKIAT